MPCSLPIAAYQLPSGAIQIGQPKIGKEETLLLPCGKCLGCRTANARAWALRCHLELQDHEHTVFATLTYSPQWLPPTLQKRDLQRFLKKLRKRMGPTRHIRFFACGEYGTQNARPHYHIIIFGLGEAEAEKINKAWGLGHTDVKAATPKNIAYTTRYTAKKLGDDQYCKREYVDPETGEVFEWQPPFLQMSRKPGIGGNARKHTASWKEYAIMNGVKQPVPRYYHAAWKATATDEQIAQLAEKRKLTPKQIVTLQMLEAQEKIIEARQDISAAKRKL
ncbi:replication initiator protein [Blackfly microvirus SF02]|uniref:Replication initiator protein n=1 Tax=Blackfly microvirus SF02 TaxID=2576452 RepID=A0A4V1F5I1_9VIRU|nr:replication initiator protein [Blackfly microvirus SF02]